VRNPFTFAYIEEQLATARRAGYEFIRCIDYVVEKRNIPTKCVVMRVDIDENVAKTDRLLTIFSLLNIKATFFVRLHGKYNPLEFSNFLIIKRIVEDGHELGYHSEIVDESEIWSEEPSTCLKRDLKIMSAAFGVEIQGVASHGGRTGLNNLDFWHDRSPKEFGLMYEAYDREPDFGLFHKSLYISDSEWTQWKSYLNGRLLVGDKRSLCEHLEIKQPLVYLLIHPETYFDRHPYD